MNNKKQYDEYKASFNLLDAFSEQFMMRHTQFRTFNLFLQDLNLSNDPEKVFDDSDPKFVSKREKLTKKWTNYNSWNEFLKAAQEDYLMYNMLGLPRS